MFYIKPPDGCSALHLLEDIVFTRLEYLEALHQNKSEEFIGNIEYLIEDSSFDSIGHFLLRLFSATSIDLFTFWLKRETLFFSHRLNHLLPRQLNRLFRRMIKYTKQENQLESNIDRTLIEFCTFFLRDKIFYHIIDKNHPDDCEKYCIEVDFTLVPDLVKYRYVELRKGRANILCSVWKDALISLFQTFINYRVYGDSLVKKNIDVLNDPRLISLNMRIQNSLLAKGLNKGKLTYKDIDVKVTKFPLCMRNLHNVLRERHRLSHYARFYYTLFLKECGMNIEDVVQYWKEEYSKPHLCGSTCTHDWQKDERKFVYSIRHIYGLEGRKANYRAQSCSAICKNIPNPNFEGGCPFKNFDTKILRKLLSSYLPETDINSLLEYYWTGNSQEMCKRFLMLTNKNIEHNFIVSSPVDYFLRNDN